MTDGSKNRHALPVGEGGARIGGEVATKDLSNRARGAPKAPVDPVPIEVAVVWSGIDDLDHPSVATTENPLSELPIDALAVGHYAGTTRLTGAERSLDYAISRALSGKSETEYIPSKERLLSMFSRRNMIRGELGQLFFLPDPCAKDRVIALAGMGNPGSFGISALTLLARELCWSLGRMGKRHLATTVIGTGEGNLKLEDALAAWMRGSRLAVSELEQDPRWHLQRITFVTHDAESFVQLRTTIDALAKREAKRANHRSRLDIQVRYPQGGTPRSREGLTLTEAMARKREPRSPSGRLPESRLPVPTRITVAWPGKRLRFAAITETASVPERDVQLDPTLIAEANDRLTRFQSSNDQLEWGRYMGRLLLPRELLTSRALDKPIVMVVDNEAARIHWEMIAQPQSFGGGGVAPITMDLPMEGPSSQATGGAATSYQQLGVAQGLTRQLRTAFAPPPEPPPPRRRVLRALIVANPSDNLPGAAAEAREIVRLFEAFNEHWGHTGCGVDYEVLIGAAQATRNDVLYRLTRREAYDILHYAGHCAYDEKDIEASGWVFKNEQRLAVQELNRIERVPRFIFSNACESGKFPGRDVDPSAKDSNSELARRANDSYTLAPTFAEAFFARGVSNFVCTAWSVDDACAGEFAVALYAQLLGLQSKGDPEKHEYEAENAPGPQPMYVAMRAARGRILTTQPLGVATWGAYQHYGDPYFQLFDPERKKLPDEEGAQSGGAPSSLATQRNHWGENHHSQSVVGERATIPDDAPPTEKP